MTRCADFNSLLKGNEATSYFIGILSIASIYGKAVG